VDIQSLVDHAADEAAHLEHGKGVIEAEIEDDEDESKVTSAEETSEKDDDEDESKVTFAEETSEKDDDEDESKVTSAEETSEKDDDEVDEMLLFDEANMRKAIRLAECAYVGSCYCYGF
jgi:hypothetical protein